MKDFFKRLARLAIIVFIVLFLFFGLVKISKVNINLRHRKVLEVLFGLSLFIIAGVILFKSLSGYRRMIENKDKEIFLELLKIIGLVVLLALFIEFILSRRGSIRISPLYGILRLVGFIVITLGISYDEMIK